MATVGEIRAWLHLIPDEAEFVVWDEREREREVIAVAHVANEKTGAWGKAIVCADNGKGGFSKKAREKARLLRVVK